jgi:DNA-directed RNA polymerase specialized sigma24 family protein
VAESLGMPVGTVKSRVHRARDSLASVLSDELRKGSNEN